MIHNYRILIAEDDYLVSRMIGGLLDEIGHTVVGEAMNGLESIELTRTLHPDLVLMDIKMPDMNGIEAAQEIYRVCPTPIVALTAYDNPDLVQQAGEAGIGAYLVKPSSVQELERAITIAMARFEDLMALRRLNTELQQINEERQKLIVNLQNALNEIKTLRGFIPICASCKKIRDDAGFWTEIEIYVRDHTEAQFSHGICPDCARKLYPDMFA